MMDRAGWRLWQKRGLGQGWEEEPLQAKDRSSPRLGSAGTTCRGTADFTQNGEKSDKRNTCDFAAFHGPAL